MSLKEYHRLADLFSKLNSQENIEDDFTSMPDAEKLKFFWENCVQEKIDSSSIIEKTQRKMRKDAMKRRKKYFLVASASIAASFLICISTIYSVELIRFKVISKFACFLTVLFHNLIERFLALKHCTVSLK